MSTISNPGTAGRTYSDDGRVIGAGERLDGVTLDATGRGAVAVGYLLEEDDPAPATPAKTDDTADTSQASAPARRPGKTAPQVP